ncbi:PKD domain protein [Candidatus Magnetomorum sp. HK-1]|nr:PKD domain protein [Candidatus Magnetomorum sp. HK-1]
MGSLLLMDVGMRGGLYIFDASPTIQSCHIKNNHAIYGGGVYIGGKSFTKLTNCLIESNKAEKAGGGIYCNKGAEFTLKKSELLNNIALKEGGGIAFINEQNRSCAKLSQVNIDYNIANISGGGIYANLSNFEIDNSFITRNQKNGIVLNDSLLTLIQNTIVQNGLTGIRADSSQYTIINTIVWGNEQANIEDSNSKSYIAYSNIQGKNYGVSNIDVDPFFKDSENGNFHLKKYSQCLNKGTQVSLYDYDYENDQRPIDGAYDIGADESLPYTFPKAKWALVIPENLTEPLYISITNYSESEDPVQSCILSYSDGTSFTVFDAQSVSKPQTVMFPQEGTYELSLTITDLYGESDSISKTITVLDSKPYTQFTISPTYPYEKETVWFKVDQKPYDSENAAFDWMISYDNNVVYKNGEICSHTFPEEGQYTITLRVTDSDGQIGISSRIIEINDTAPIAKFSIDKYDGLKPLTIHIKNQITSNELKGYTWIFSDGTTSYFEDITNTTHTFVNLGEYSVRLIVEETDDDIAVSETKRPIIVNYKTRFVCQESGCRYTRIQDAINDSSNGGVVKVKAGTYFETIDFMGKQIHLMAYDDSEKPIIDGCKHRDSVVKIMGEAKYSVLDGFKIVNGTRSGVWVEQASALIRNCVIEKNHNLNGGGIFCVDGSNLSIHSSKIINNNAGLNGGGIFCVDGSNLSIHSSKIINNNAGLNGGGIFCVDGSNLSIHSSKIINNNADLNGGGILYDSGHGIFNDNVSNLNINSTKIVDNIAKYIGGGMLISGGDYRKKELPISNCKANLSNIIVDNNQADFSEAGISVYNAKIYISNSFITRNQAHGTEKADGIGVIESNLLSIHNTIANNDIQNGIGFYAESSKYTIINSIICGSGQTSISENNSLSHITYSNIQGKYKGEGNIDVKANFIDPEIGNFHLDYSSQCLNKGTNTFLKFDYDGDQRPLDEKFDIGADESIAYSFTKAKWKLDIPKNQTEPLCITITNLSEPNEPVQSYLLSYSDGISYTEFEAQPFSPQTVTFLQQGTYLLSLTVIDLDGYSNSISQTITVLNSKPYTQFTVSPSNPFEKEVVSFKVDQKPYDSEKATYDWIFSDDNDVTFKSGEMSSYTFSEEGQYTVTLIVTDSDGQSCTSNKIIKIKDTKPIAQFSIDKYDGLKPLTIHINNQLTSKELKGYTWIFSDGTTSYFEEITNTTHTFYELGEYKVSLIVEETDGDTAITETTNPIRVNYKTRVVCQDSGCSYTRIQDSINDSSDFGVVKVKAGRYFESIDFMGKQIHLMAYDDSEKPIIDGSKSDDSIVKFTRNESNFSILDGFKIVNGKNSGIFIQQASPMIRNCVVEKNHISLKGYGAIDIISLKGYGAIDIRSESFPIIEECKVQNNESFVTGGIYSIDSNLTLNSTEIINNISHFGGGAILFYGNNFGDRNKNKYKANFSGIKVDNNRGGGIFADYANIHIKNSFITRNHDQGILEADGVIVYHSNFTSINNTIANNNLQGIEADSSQYTIINSIIWGNGQKSIIENDSISNISYSNIQGGYKGEGNIDVNPSFIDPETGNFHLDKSSQCLNKGTNSYLAFDYDGDQRPLDDKFDIGADETIAYTFTKAKWKVDIPANQTEPLCITIINLSEPNEPVQSYLLSYSDGTTYTEFEAQPFEPQTVTFLQQGTYLLSLTVLDLDGYSNSISQTITVLDSKPYTQFTVSPSNPFEKEVVNFKVDKKPYDSKKATYDWIFSDDKDVIFKSGEMCSYTFPEEGQYTVTLIVTDSDGQSCTSNKIIEIKDTKPIAQFSIDKYDGLKPLTIHINNQLTSKELKGYTWIFSDGTASYFEEITNTTHTFYELGEYKVSLIVEETDGDDAITETTNPIRVNYKTRVVCQDSGCSYTRIQDAINDSSDFGVVKVKAGRYFESINFMGKQIHLMGYDDSEKPIIDASASGTEVCVVSFISNETKNSVLDGFKVVNGSDAGIKIEKASPLIRNCVIENNSGGGCGGIRIRYESSPIIEHSVIQFNTSTFAGGGICCFDNSHLIVNSSKITNNDGNIFGGGILCMNSPSIVLNKTELTNNVAGAYGSILINGNNKENKSKVEFTEVKIDNNSGCGVFVQWANIKIKNSYITRNHALENDEADGIGIRESNLLSIHNTIANNGIQDGIGIYAESSQYTIINSIIYGSGQTSISENNSLSHITYSNIQGEYEGEGNINVLPNFIDPDSGNFHLSKRSECLNKGKETFLTIDYDGDLRPLDEKVDIGADEITANTFPVAKFHVSTETGTEPLTITITNLSTSSEGIDSYYLSFSEEPSGVTLNQLSTVQHMFLQKGVYSVDLTITEYDGDTSSFSRAITVLDASGNHDAGESIIISDDSFSLKNIIDQADENTIIWIKSGEYVETDTIVIDKPIILMGHPTNNESVVIRNNSKGSVFYIKDTTDVILNGFKIQGGQSEFGGAIYCENSNPVLSNLLIIKNEALSQGGGIYCKNSSPKILHVTMANNEKSGIYFDKDSYPEIINAIIYGNSPYDIVSDKDANAEHLIIQNSSIQTIDIYPDSISFGADIQFMSPQFENPSDDNYLLSSTSPCIGAARYTHLAVRDILGNYRPFANDTNPDIGAFENSLDLPIIDPMIYSVSSALELTSTVRLIARVHSKDIQGVWAYAIPPGNLKRFLYSHNSLTESLLSRYLKKMDLKLIDGDEYQLTYDDFEIFGDYDFILFAQNKDNMLSSSWSLKITQTTGKDFNDYVKNRNDCPKTASPIISSDVYSPIFNFDSPDDEDWYTFYGKAGSTITLTLTNIGEHENVSMEICSIDKNADKKILYPQNRKRSVANASDNDRFTFQPEKTTQYYSKMFQRTRGQSGEYQFNITSLNTEASDSSSNPSIIYVCQSTCEYSSIQEAIQASSDNYTILVDKGDYYESIVIEENIAVISIHGPKETTINGDTIQPVVTFQNSESATPLLEGFTIKNGDIGVLIKSQSRPTINKCIITKNMGTNGGGILCENASSPTIKRCIISENVVSSDGGGVYCKNASIYLENCIISDNYAMSENGSGLYLSDTRPSTIINCTIVNNESEDSGILIDESDGKIINTIIWGNVLYESSSNMDIEYSTIEDDSIEGPTIYHFDPEFVDTNAGNYHIKYFSKCINKGTSDGVPMIDIDGDQRPFKNKPAIGADEFFVDVNAHFNVETDDTTEPATVSFSITPYSELPELSYIWDFDDAGYTSTHHSPNHEYLQNGQYSVVLMLIDFDGYVFDQQPQSITIVDSEPIVDFEFTPSSGKEPLVVNFNSLSESYDPIVEYYWDFGDGTPKGTGKNITHTYAQDGEYRISLTVVDSDGSTVPKISDSIDIIVSDSDPFARFEMSLTSCLVDQPIYFTNTSESYDTIVQTIWDFGDNITKTGDEVSHYYTKPGNYNVLLTVIDDDGDPSSTSNLLTIDYPKPEPKFSFSPKNPSEGDVIFFENKTNNKYNIVASYQWDFGDESQPITDVNTTHKYLSDGEFNVSLTVVDINGDKSYLPEPIIIKVKDTKPKADFSIYPQCETQVCEDAVMLTCTEKIQHVDEIDYSWKFNGHADDLINEPLSKYIATEGTYIIELIAREKLSGEGNSITKTVHIKNRKQKEVCYNSSECHYASIQDAIDASQNGDIITVRPGVYLEQIDFKGHSLTIEAKEPQEETRIDGGKKGPVVTISNTSKQPKLKGFTIIEGNSEKGGGILINNASPIIEDCSIRRHFAQKGGGIYIVGNSSARLTNCLIEANHATNGGGIYCDSQSQLTINGSDIAQNSAFENGGGIYCNNDRVTIQKSFIKKNIAQKIGAGFMLEGQSILEMYQSYIYNNVSNELAGGGYISEASSMSITSSLMTHNTAREGGLFYIKGKIDLTNITATQNTTKYQCIQYAGKNANVSIINSILWNDIEDEFCWENETHLDISYSDIWQTNIPGHNIFQANPSFIDNNSNFSLRYGSHCLIEEAKQINKTYDDYDGKQWPNGIINIGAYINNFYEKHKPIIFFTAETLEDYINIPILFTDQSYPVKNNAIVERMWNFGDGTPAKTSEAKTITHSYQTPGIYTVSLTVKDNDGLTNTKTKEGLIKINAEDFKPVARFDVNTRDSFTQKTIVFTDRSNPRSDTITKWIWDFGDGKFSTEKNPRHQYTQPGQYTVKLSVENIYGVDYAWCRITIANSKPVAEFSARPKYGIQRLNVTFSNESTTPVFAPITSCLWDFGDGAATHENCENVVHKYNEPGSYTVTLTVESSEGQDLTYVTSLIHILDYTTTWTVCSHGCEYTSIQSAIKRADDGHIVLVYDGIYSEHIDFMGKAITVRSKNGHLKTILNGITNESMVRFQNKEDKDSILQGFTIQNGNNYKGGGIYISNASPLIKDCVIKDNHAISKGGGVYISSHSYPLIESCIIHNNTSTVDGGGIYCKESSEFILKKSEILENIAFKKGGGIACENYQNQSCASLSQVNIDGNIANISGGGIYLDMSTIQMDNSYVTRNQSVGIHLIDSHFTSIQNTLAKNGQSGIRSESSYYTLINSIVWDNGQTNIDGTNSLSFISHSNIQGSQHEETIIDVDPLFKDADNGDFHLKKHSQCHNKGQDLSLFAYDYEGDHRPIDDAFDMGADESIANSTPEAKWILDIPEDHTEPLSITITDRSVSKEPFKSAIISISYSDGMDYTKLDAQQPFSTIKFHQQGIFVVSLIVKDLDGEADSISETFTVLDSTPYTQFTGPSTAKEREVVNFKIHKIPHDHENAIYEWIITGNNNLIPESGEKCSDAENCSYTFPGEGTYTVTLKVTDSDGQTGIAHKTIQIKDTHPKAKFKIDQYSGFEPFTIEITNQLQSDELKGYTWVYIQITDQLQSDELKGYTWVYHDWDGYSEVFGQKTSHTFIEPGSYSVVLVVEETDGDIDITYTKNPILVNSRTRTVCQDDSCQYTSIQDAIEKSWDFGEVIVKPGRYLETINFNGRIINVRAENKSEKPVIDGRLSGDSVVKFSQNETSDAVLDGFKIINGQATHGGGIYISHASPQIRNCIIENNHAIENGGGIYIDNALPQVSNCIIENNQVNENGGGIYINHASPQLHNCIIENNQATENGGGTYISSESYPLIENSLIQHNTSTVDGGGIYCSDNSHLILSTTEITNNIAQKNGGGIVWLGNHQNSLCKADLSKIKIDNNQSSTSGGGIFAKWANVTINNSFITRNQVLSNGNAGGVALNDSIFTFLHDTIAYNGTDIQANSSQYTITNSIIWSNGQNSLIDTNSQSTITYSNIRGGHEGEGNIDVDPYFDDPETGNFHLNKRSGCLNKGTESLLTIDYDNDQRPIDEAFDIGADEITANTFPIAKFDVSAYSGTEPLTITVYNRSSSLEGIKNYYLSFSDESTGYTLTSWSSRQYVYTQNGNYTIRLTVTEFDGDMRPSSPEGITVVDSLPCAKFTWNSSKPVEKRPVTFSIETEPYDKEPVTYEWRIGDNPSIESGSSYSYTFINDGKYPVSLTVTDSDGQKDYTHNVITIADTEPDPSFTVEQKLGFEPFNVTFTNTSKTEEPKVYTWIFGTEESKVYTCTFGNEGYCNKIEPNFTFIKPGEHIVYLILEETDGDIEPYSSTITVKPSTRNVCKSGCQYSSIQKAIDDSCNGGTIEVGPGTYYENIDFREIEITLKSLEGPDRTIIASNQFTDNIVQIINKGSKKTILDGFTIQNMQGSSGRGIYIYQASPIIRNCKILSCSADEGGGLHISEHSEPEINHCVIQSNEANGNGGGIHVTHHSRPVINRCIIDHNSSIDDGGGIFVSNDSMVFIKESKIRNNNSNGNGGGLFVNNQSNILLTYSYIHHNQALNGGGLYKDNAHVKMINCLIHHNGASENGAFMFTKQSHLLIHSTTITENMVENMFDDIQKSGGIYSEGSDITITNTIFWNNQNDIVEINSGNKDITYSNIDCEKQELSNIHEDPEFIDSVSNYRLKNYSKCINKGTSLNAPSDDIEHQKRPYATSHNI